MKKRLMATLLTLCMLFSLLPTTALAADANPFTDVKSSDWYYDAVRYVKSEGLMAGTSDTAFSPNTTTTRGMIVTILWRLAGSPEVTGTQFADVDDGQYYADAILWASKNSIVSGYGDNAFGPNDPITRQCMATILYRYAEYADYDVSAAADLSEFADEAEIAAYAEAPLAWASAEGLISGMGDGILAPQGSATRAQVAVILYRFCQLLDGGSSAQGDYTVTFKWNYSGKGTYKTVSVDEGETVNEPTKPTRSGYTFKGWYTKANGGEKFDFDTEITASITLYAQWSSNGGGGGGHTHSWGEWEPNGNGTHTRVCTKNSSHTETEACDNKGENGACSVCGDTTEYVAEINGIKYATLADAVDAGGEIVLLKDVYLTETVVVTEGKTVTVDLNGKAITVSKNEETGRSLYAFDNYGTMTLKDSTGEGSITARGIENFGTMTVESGKIISCDDNGGAAIWNETKGETTATLTINGGTFETAEDVDGEPGDPACLINNTAAVTVINGGTFNGKADWAYAVISSGDITINDAVINGRHGALAIDDGTAIVNGSTMTVEGSPAMTDHLLYVESGVLTINGGSYELKDDGGSVGDSLLYGSNLVVAGGTYNEDPTDYVANGYKVVNNNDGTYTVELGIDTVVAKIGANAYATLSEAVAAAQASDTVVMVADATETATKGGYNLAGIVHNNGCTINGNGYTLTVTGADSTWDCAIYTTGGTIKDLTINGAFRGIFTAGLSSDLYVDNCVIDNVCYTFSADGSGDYDVSFTNTTLNGWTSYTSGFQSVSFTDCTFGKGTGGYQYAYLRPYSDTTITNCEFSEGFELDASRTDVVKLDNCTVGGVDLTVENLVELLGEDAKTAIVNGKQLLADGLAMDADGNYVVTNANGLAAVNSLVGVSGSGDQTVILSADTTYDMIGVTWTPIKVDGYHGADIMTVEGNGATITNLSAPLFAGGFAGESGIVISDLTIASSEITSTSNQGSGAFIECVDSMETITLTNCHLVDSTVTGSRTGGLIGWTSGYSNQNDGPVKTYVDITDCSVVDCTISGTGSVGGIIGHAGASDWTYHTITNCTVENTTLTSDDTDSVRVGTIVGTANVGEVTITDCTATNVTLTQNDQSVDEKAYGRFVPGTTGKLVIDGILITNEAIEGADGLAAALESVSSMTGEVTLPVEGAELGWETGAQHGSTPFLGENATVETVVIDGGETGATLTATGAGVGPIRAANEGTLVFKNITFVDQSESYAENAWEFAYLEMGGKLVFEDCTFADPIQLGSDAEATFTNCTFEGKTVDGLTMYAVWLDDGSATFDGCTITGTRGIKAHEAYGSDVIELVIDGCTFDSLSEKPGIAIGDVDADTAITITDSEFINCKAGDQGLYIYETDTDVETFAFTESGNTVTND